MIDESENTVVHGVHGGQRLTWGAWFSVPIMQVPKIELRSIILASYTLMLSHPVRPFKRLCFQKALLHNKIICDHNKNSKNENLIRIKKK